MRKKIILRQIIGVWAENDLKIGIFETDQPIVYKQQAKLPKFPQKQDNNKWPSKGPSGLSHLSEGQCLWLYYLQQEENHCQLSDFMTQYTFECLEDVGGPDPHQTQNPPKENMHGGGGYPSWGCFAASIQHATLRETCGSSSETIDPTPWINSSEMKLFRNKIRVSDWSNTSVDMKHTRSSSWLQILQTAFLHSETAWSQISSHIMLSCTWCLLNYLIFDDFSFCFKKRKLNK